MLFSDTSNYYKWYWLGCFLMEANLQFIFNLGPLIIFKVSVVFVKDAKVAGKAWAIYIKFAHSLSCQCTPESCETSLGESSSVSACPFAVLERGLIDVICGSCSA